MGDLLPLFPLRTVLFPEMLLPLHIFEPRYQVLLRRSLERKAPFGVALIRSGAEVGGPAEPYRVGTTARIADLTKLPREHAFIVVRGERRFEIQELIRDTEPYLVARVRYLSEEMGADALRLAADAAEAYADYRLAVTTVGGRSAPDLSEQREPPSPGLPRGRPFPMARSSIWAGEGGLAGAGSPRDVAYGIAAGLAVDTPERQRLLELSAISELLGAELRILERENALLREVLVRQHAKGKGPRLH